MTQWAIAFLLTVGIEAPIVAALVAGVARRRRLVVPAAVAAQLVTHPALWLAVPPAASTGHLIAAELGVIVFEAIGYALTLAAPWRRCALAALLANAASLGLGSIVA